jgi:hypothetical protein
MKKLAACTIGLMLVGLTSSAFTAVLHVPSQYKFIHDAVQACGYGDTVLVAAGTYHDCTHETEGPGSTPACVIMQSGVTLIGAGPDATIIDAQTGGVKDGRGIFVEGVSDCRIENLQVTDCFAEVYGAGILIRQVDSSVEVTDVKIYDNGDGGIIVINNAHPVLTRIDFIDNHAKLGGGLSIEENSNPTVTDCYFDNNSAPTGGGLMVRVNSNPVISGCVIENNFVIGNGEGGGIAVVNSSPEISNCEVLNNTTQGSGGGISLNSSTGSISDCVVQGNQATGGNSLGGGVYASGSTMTLTNLLIVDNQTTGGLSKGGGVYCSLPASPTLQNCTIVGNGCAGAGNGGGVTCDWGSVATIDKCIIAFSTAGAGLSCLDQPGPIYSVPHVSCCDIYGNEGGDAVCGKDLGGNIAGHPRFCESPGIEYHLGSNSPCAPANHPGGPTICDGELIGARPVGCGFTGAPYTVVSRPRLLGAAPNPFNPQTRIFFVLPEAGPATLRIYDARGRAVKTLALGELAAGEHGIIWNGTNDAGRAVASGVYYTELEAGGWKQTQGMALIR